MLLGGNDVDADADRGLKLLMKAAESDDPNILRRIARVYDKGLGIPQNLWECETRDIGRLTPKLVAFLDGGLRWY